MKRKNILAIIVVLLLAIVVYRMYAKRSNPMDNYSYGSIEPNE